MKTYLVAIFVAVASARPEAPGGYSYPAPGGLGQGIGGGSYVSAGQGLGGGSYVSAGQGLGGGSYVSAGQGLGGGIGISSGFDSSSSFSSGGGAGFVSDGYASAGPTVQKHVYVHVAPEEPEVQRPQRVYPVAAPQKHYKIIFIKAPSPPNPTAPIIPAQPQNEEKTLVYVLVKKPEEQPEIVIPTPAPTQPSKPEVYFIRYKTQKEAAAAGFGAGGAISGSGAGDLSGHGGVDLSGGDLSSGGPATGSFASASAGAGAAPQYGPPGYHK